MQADEMSARNSKSTFPYKFPDKGISLFRKTLSLQTKQTDKDDCRQTTKVIHTDNTADRSRFRRQCREQRQHSRRVSAVCLSCRTGLPQLGNIPIAYRSPSAMSDVCCKRLPFPEHRQAHRQGIQECCRLSESRQDSQSCRFCKKRTSTQALFLCQAFSQTDKSWQTHHLARQYNHKLMRQCLLLFKAMPHTACCICKHQTKPLNDSVGCMGTANRE